MRWPVPVCVTEKASVCSHANQRFARAALQGVAVGSQCDTRDDADCQKRGMNPRSDSYRPLLARVTGLRHAFLHIYVSSLAPACAFRAVAGFFDGDGLPNRFLDADAFFGIIGLLTCDNP